MINLEPDENGDIQGFLNDWDLAKTEEALLNCDGPSQPGGISVSSILNSGRFLMIALFLMCLSHREHGLSCLP